MSSLLENLDDVATYDYELHDWVPCGWSREKYLERERENKFLGEWFSRRQDGAQE